MVFAAHAVGRHNALTESGAVLYFVARLADLPLSALGVPLVRSLVWNVAALGMTLMLVALLWKPAG